MSDYNVKKKQGQVSVRRLEKGLKRERKHESFSDTKATEEV